jgi:uncharacterized cysteine cluster protein YcgN (CxxCxxCC family)
MSEAKRKVGRPKGSTKPNHRTHEVIVRFNDDEWDSLCTAAKKCGMTKAKFIRMALEEYYINTSRLCSFELL